MSEFSKRDASVYNKLRTAFQWVVCHVFVGAYAKLGYKYKVEGKENVPKNERFIVAANHISNVDPFLMPLAIDVPVAFMAKKELFEKRLCRFLMDYCGAFEVNREKVEVSTIKTAINIKNTSWMLGLFPQGTRDTNNEIKKISKGFASFAKATKAGILPIAIIGADKKPKLFNKSELNIKIGELIPYSNDIEDMMRQWCQTLSRLTGHEYVLE